MSIEIGSKLGPYEILSSVGAGGMGEVYRARDSRLDREVAIKVLPRRMAQDTDARTRFEREAQAVAALTHPNILSIFDVGFVEESPYYVTELLEGETLRSRLVSEPKLSWQKAADIGTQLAEGLAAAHAKGIIHRDLKPENIFLTSDDRVKILDFGLARIDRSPESGEHSSAPTAISHTEPGTVLGTVGYMSPEQVRGLPADERSDIFSLGCVLYEMVTGSRAFTGETASDIMAAILRDEVRNPADSGAAVPFQFEWIIDTCLKKDPASRFQKARELRAELRSLQGSGEAHFFQKTTRLKVEPEPERSSRRLLAVLGVLLLVLVAAGVWHYLPSEMTQPEELPPIRSLAVLPFDIGAADQHVEYLSDDVAEGIINRLSGQEGVQVMAWSTVEKYKKQPQDPMKVGRELGVDAVLTGRVSVKDDLVSVQASLIDSRRGFQVWGDRFEHPFVRGSAFQEEVTRQVADRLGLDLPAQEAQMAQADDPEAFKFYLEGRHFERQQKELEREVRQETQKQPPKTDQQQDPEKAAAAAQEKIKAQQQKEVEIWQAQVESFKKAVELDKDFVQAQQSLAESLADAGISGVVAPRDIMPQVKDAANRLIQLDKDSGSAYVILGTVHSRFDRDWTQAGELLRKAVDLEPRSAKAHHRYAMDYLVPAGRLDEALDQMRQAVKLEPDDAALQAELGRVLYYSRRYEEAADLLEDVTDETPGARAYHYLALTFLKAGRSEDAVTVLKGLLMDDEDGDIQLLRPEKRQTMALLGLAYGMSGQRQLVRRILGRFERTAKGFPSRPGMRSAGREPVPPPPAPPASAQAPPPPGHPQGAQFPGQRSFRFDFYPNAGWPYWLAHVYIGLGDQERAIQLLSQAVDAQVGEAIYLKADPIFDPLRSNPGFQELLRKLNLE